jgi:hypothetical protein
MSLLFRKIKSEYFSANTATCYCNYFVNKIMKLVILWEREIGTLASSVAMSLG